MSETRANIVFQGARIVQCTVDPDSGVISEVTPHGIPQFIEIGLKDGNVLKVYADGTHSDMDEFRFVEYQAPSNYPARKWLFEQFLRENFPWLWQVYRLTCWQRRQRSRVFTWYLNRTEKCPHAFHGWGNIDDLKTLKRYPFLRLPWHRPRRQSCFCRCCCAKNMTEEQIKSELEKPSC